MEMNIEKKVLISCELEEKETSLIVPDGVQTIAESAIAHNPFVKKIVLPASVKSIRKEAFSGCLALRDLTIPAPATIRTQAFSGLPYEFFISGKLTLIAAGGKADAEVPETFLSMGRTGLMGLKTLVVGEGIVRIGKRPMRYAFCTSVTLPESLKELGEESLSYGDWRKIAIPRGVKRIEKRAFAGCRNLCEVCLSRETEVAEDAFENCPKVQFSYYEDEKA